ncbi:MAG: methyltransferase, partial [Candidatus Latescibacteria bacterium]|nr:methyltransferase [Candidatus Latescibacterota bacterium]
MTHKERFYATIERKPVDRPASWLGLPVPDAHKGLFETFGVDSVDALKVEIDDDVYPVELPYHAPDSDAIYAAFGFAKKTRHGEKERTLTAPGFFEDYTDPARVEEFDWPDPARYIDPEACRKVVDEAPENDAVLGVVWSAHFQDACAAFGMETALMTMMTEPDMFRAVIDRITDFYLQANERFYRATEGQLDAVLIGN